MATKKEFSDTEKQIVLEWLKKSLKTKYSDIRTIGDCSVGEFKREIPMLLILAEKALSIDWKTEKRKVNDFIKKFEGAFQKPEETQEYFKKIKDDLFFGNEIKIGIPEEIFFALNKLVQAEKNPKNYTIKKSEGFKEFFDVANRPNSNFLEMCKKIQEAFLTKGSSLREDVWGSQSSTEEPKEEEKKTSGSAASSKEDPVFGGRAKNKNTSPENDEEKRKEDIKDKVTDNIKTTDEIRRANNEPFARIFSLNPSEMRDKVNKDRKYDFKKEFDEFQAAIGYAHGMYNYIDKIRKNAPKARLSKIDKARTKIKFAEDKIAAYYNEAKDQYDITHKLGYITDREAQNLVSRIFKCIRKANMELLKLGEAMTDADIMTWREARANVAEYFKRRSNEIFRDVWEGTRTTRNIRDWVNEKRVIAIVRDIQNSFPPEEAEKMVKEFKNAYYNVSPENDQKLAEIKMALSDAHNEKAKQEMKKTKEVVKTAFNKVKEGLLRKGDIKDVYYDLDEKGNRINYKETLKNKGLLPRAKEKTKSIFDKVAGKIGS